MPACVWACLHAYSRAMHLVSLHAHVPQCTFQHVRLRLYSRAYKTASHCPSPYVHAWSKRQYTQLAMCLPLPPFSLPPLTAHTCWLAGCPHCVRWRMVPAGMPPLPPGLPLHHALHDHAHAWHAPCCSRGEGQGGAEDDCVLGDRTDADHPTPATCMCTGRCCCSTWQ